MLNASNMIEFFKGKKLSHSSSHAPRRPTLEQLIEMVAKEAEFRLDSRYIEECDSVANIPNGWLTVTEKWQKNIVSSFGFMEGLEADWALNSMRRARYDYMNEKLLKIGVHIENNLATPCIYNIGDIIPNISINNMNKAIINLYDIFSKTQMNLLIASSHS
jgi:hypothetical protein